MNRDRSSEMKARHWWHSARNYGPDSLWWVLGGHASVKQPPEPMPPSERKPRYRARYTRRAGQ